MECSNRYFSRKKALKKVLLDISFICVFFKNIFNPYHEIYEVPSDIEMVFRLYSDKEKSYLEKNIDFSNLEDIPKEYDLAVLFENAAEFLGDNIGYISLFSTFGGWNMFSSMQKNNSLTLEHCF